MKRIPYLALLAGTALALTRMNAQAASLSLLNAGWGCPGSVDAVSSSTFFISAGCFGNGNRALSSDKLLKGGYFSMPIVAPAAVGQFSGLAVQQNELVISWTNTGDENNTDAHGNSTQYYIMYSTYYALVSTNTSQNPPNVSIINQSTSSTIPSSIIGPGFVSTLTQSSLGVNTRYYFTMFMRNPLLFWSGKSVPMFRYTLAKAPQNTGIIATSSTTVRLGWERNGNPNNTLFQGWCDVSIDFDRHPRTANVVGTAVDFTGLFPGTTYYFKVRARNGDGIATGYGLTVPVRTSSTKTSRPSIENGQTARATSLGYLVEKSEPIVTVGTEMAQAGSAAAILVRNVPATMLAISPTASGISPLMLSGGCPSIAPTISVAVSIEVWNDTRPQR